LNNGKTLYFELEGSGNAVPCYMVASMPTGWLYVQGKADYEPATDFLVKHNLAKNYEFDLTGFTLDAAACAKVTLDYVKWIKLPSTAFAEDLAT
jgi:hypothetical protein